MMQQQLSQPATYSNRQALAAPSAYSYADEIAKQVKLRRRSEAIIYATTWSPCGNYLLAGNCFSAICVWNCSPCFHQERNDGSDNKHSSAIMKDEPICSFQIKTGGTIHDLVFQCLAAGGGSEHFLLVSTATSGCLVYKWSDLMAQIDTIIQSNADDTISTSTVDISNHTSPTSTFRPAGRSGCVLSASCDMNLGLINAASGSDGILQWDIESGNYLGAMYFSRDSDGKSYRCVKSISSRGLLVAGGEMEGFLEIWDTKNRKNIQIFDIAKTMNENAQLLKADTGSTPFSSWKHGNNLWVSDLDVDVSGNWLTCCGGVEGGTRRNNFNGFLNVFYLQTRSLVSGYTTARETIHSAAYHEAFNKIVTTSNDGTIQYWNRPDVTRVAQARLSSGCGYSISINPMNAYIAVGGAGSLVDCFAQLGNRSFSVSF